MLEILKLICTIVGGIVLSFASVVLMYGIWVKFFVKEPELVCRPKYLDKDGNIDFERMDNG